MKELKQVYCEPPECEGSRVEQKFWNHTADIPIQRPTKAQAWTPESRDRGMRLFFDGGCKNREGTGGYLLFDAHGECVGGEGRWYGKSAPTNNIAEAQAMVDALEFVGQRAQG